MLIECCRVPLRKESIHLGMGKEKREIKNEAYDRSAQVVCKDQRRLISVFFKLVLMVHTVKCKTFILQSGHVTGATLCSWAMPKAMCRRSACEYLRVYM